MCLLTCALTSSLPVDCTRGCSRLAEATSRGACYGCVARASAVKCRRFDGTGYIDPVVNGVAKACDHKEFYWPPNFCSLCARQPSGELRELCAGCISHPALGSSAYCRWVTCMPLGRACH